MTAINTKQLTECLSSVSKILPSNKAKKYDFLRSILLTQSTDNIVEITASNLTTNFKFSIEQLDMLYLDNGRKLTPTVLPFELFSDLVKKISSDTIELNNDDTTEALIVSANHGITTGEYKIKSRDINDFPCTSIKTSNSHAICIDRQKFEQIVKCLSFAKKDSSKNKVTAISVLENIYLRHDISNPTNLSVWASDGTFFIEETIPLDEVTIDSTYQAILSPDFILAVWAIEWETITLEFSDETIMMKTENIIISQRQDQALVKTYPNFDNLIPLLYLNVSSGCTIDSQSALATLNRCKSHKVVAIVTGLNNEIKIIATDSRSTIEETIPFKGQIDNSFGVYCTKRITAMLKSIKKSNIPLTYDSKAVMLFISSGSSKSGIMGHNKLKELPYKLKNLANEVANAPPVIYNQSPEQVDLAVYHCEDILPELAPTNVCADDHTDTGNETSPCECKEFEDDNDDMKGNFSFDDDSDFFDDEDDEEVVSNGLNEFDDDDDFFDD